MSSSIDFGEFSWSGRYHIFGRSPGSRSDDGWLEVGELWQRFSVGFSEYS